MDFAPYSVLLLEDEPIIAVDVEDMLLDAGFNLVHLTSSCAEAQRWLTKQVPDVAIIDLKLRDGACRDIARTLAEKHVPFIVHTGAFRRPDAVFDKGEWLSKPSNPEDMLAAVTRSLLNPPNAVTNADIQ